MDKQEINKDPYRKLTAAKILDLGEYSMVVNTVLPDIKTFMIYGKYNEKHSAKEVIASEKGCIAYFDERVDKDFEKGCVYPVHISNMNDTYWRLEALLSIAGIRVTDPRTYSLIPNLYDNP